METPELPIELWALIATVHTVAHSNENHTASVSYIDSGVYRVLVRTAKMYAPMLGNRAKGIFIRTGTENGSQCTRLPNGDFHSINDKPSLVRRGGMKSWHQNGQLHRDGGPAITHKGGAQEWYQEGKQHRECKSLPAFIDDIGSRIWSHRGLTHRDDLPAVIDKNGTVKFFQNGKLHRANGPAVIRADGTKKWWHLGLLHRDGAPAVIYGDGKSFEWWHQGTRTKIEWHGLGSQPISIDESYQTKFEIVDYECGCCQGQEITYLSGVCTWSCQCGCNGRIIHDDNVTIMHIDNVHYSVRLN